MLTRRHIRIKVLQSLYAFYQGEEQHLDKQEKFLNYSINQMLDLQALLLQLIVAIQQHAITYLERTQKKLLATEADRNPSKNFINNEVVKLIASCEPLSLFLKNRKLDNWKNNDEYITLLFNTLKQASFYEAYLNIPNPTFQEDKDFILALYKEVIAPNDKLYEYLEDTRLTWLDDFPVVNTNLVKRIQKLKPLQSHKVFDAELYKDEEDKEFSLQLLRKVILNDDSLIKIIDQKTPNWDKERIADLDMIILKMGIAELKYFPSIPVRVSINEYIEVSKEYSTPKSSVFINGILDKLVKEFKAAGELNKIGRGLT